MRRSFFPLALYSFSHFSSGNVSGQTSDFIYLDHSNPVLTSKVNTNTQWTNVAPTIKYGATDYLAGTTYNGSGVESVSIYNDRGVCVSTGGVETSYTLCAADEGVHTFTIKASVISKTMIRKSRDCYCTLEFN